MMVPEDDDSDASDGQQIRTSPLPWCDEEDTSDQDTSDDDSTGYSSGDSSLESSGDSNDVSSCLLYTSDAADE